MNYKSFPDTGNSSLEADSDCKQKDLDRFRRQIQNL